MIHVGWRSVPRGLALALTITACKSARPPAQTAPPPPQVERAEPAAAPPVTENEADRLRRERDAADRAEAARIRAALAERIHFDFDKADIRAPDRVILDAKVPHLTGDPSIRLRIEGHADERGSDEYNLALGMRRAGAVKRYLTSRGLDGSRLETVSFGEERPLDAGHTEAAWARNRRADFQIVAPPRLMSP